MTDCYEQTLWQRVGEGNEATRKSVKLNTTRLRNSIQAHLERMFITKKGTCAANLAYGLPDLNDMENQNGFLEALRAIKKDIQTSVSKFEPRLCSLDVQHIADSDDPLLLKFEIIGQLNIAGLKDEVRFETHIAKCGIIKVYT